VRPALKEESSKFLVGSESFVNKSQVTSLKITNQVFHESLNVLHFILESKYFYTTAPKN